MPLADEPLHHLGGVGIDSPLIEVQGVDDGLWPVVSSAAPVFYLDGGTLNRMLGIRAHGMAERWREASTTFV